MLRVLGALLILWAGTAVAEDRPALQLRDFGSFHLGGREVTIAGQPVKSVMLTPGGAPTRVDPNGTYMVEQMYVQYFLPAQRHGAVPLLMWHGGGLTGVEYETTPDGRPGWLDYFVRQGWDTCQQGTVRLAERLHATCKETKQKHGANGINVLEIVASMMSGLGFSIYTQTS